MVVIIVVVVRNQVKGSIQLTVCLEVGTNKEEGGGWWWYIVIRIHKDFLNSFMAPSKVKELELEWQRQRWSVWDIKQFESGEDAHVNWKCVCVFFYILQSKHSNNGKSVITISFKMDSGICAYDRYSALVLTCLCVHGRLLYYRKIKRKEKSKMAI